MASNDSLDSPLSSVPSEEEVDEDMQHSLDGTISVTGSPSASTPLHTMPPSKRRRTGPSAFDHATPVSATADIPMTTAPASPAGSVSSDTSGEVPNSPSFANFAPTHPLSSSYAASQANPDDPEAGDVAQVTRCLWTDCPEPDQGNMDRLVDHIHCEHIGQRQKKYSCEWEGCSRKSMLHASGYALKAHMRSHTREKPFYCQLPECDRCFTRSDALAKHMRTVHETEALRPSDPVPKGHSDAAGGRGAGNGSGSSLKRIKLIVSNGGGGGGGGGGNADRSKSIVGDLPPLPTDGMPDKNGDAGPIDMDSIPFILPVSRDYYPSDMADTLEDGELSLPPSQLYRLLRRQMQWAEEESAELGREQDIMDKDNEFIVTVERKSPPPPPPPPPPNSVSTTAEKIRQNGWRQTEAVIDAILDKVTERVDDADDDNNDDDDDNNNNNDNGVVDANPNHADQPDPPPQEQQQQQQQQQQEQDQDQEMQIGDPSTTQIRSMESHLEEDGITG